MQARRIIVGISGSSGFQYGVAALRLLQPLDLEVHLVISGGAELTRQHETRFKREEVECLAHVTHPINDMAASIASGSFQNMGLLVAPCSMRTLASIAHCLSDNLLTRAADVALKERRRLLLLVRETPLNLGHLRAMQNVTEMGGIIFPPVPALYQQPQSIDQMITHSVARALHLFGLDIEIPEWGHAKAL